MSSASTRTVFMYGAGSAGRRSWPRQAEVAKDDWVFLERTGEVDVATRDATRILSELGAGGHVVGSSYGALAAMLAAAQDSSRVRSLVLFEPACFAVARGRGAVERYVVAWARPFDVACDPSVSWSEWSSLFAEATGQKAPSLNDDELRRTTERIRATVPPWTIPVDAAVVREVPTLVVTGAWADEYEEVAAALAEEGATHVRMEGFGHRPHDHPDATQLMTDWWASLSTA